MMLALLLFLFAGFCCAVALGTVLLLITSDGRASVTATVDLSVPPERAFGWFETFENLRGWHGLLVATSGDPTARFRRGDEFGSVMSLGSEHVRFVTNVRRVTPPHRLDLRSVSTAADLESAFVLEPLADGEMTRVTAYQKVSYRGLLKFFASSQEQALRGALQADLMELQRLVARP